MTFISTILATLFVDPLPVEKGWIYFAVLLMAMVGLGYKAITAVDPKTVPMKAGWFLLKSVGLMLILGFAAWLITAWV